MNNHAKYAFYYLLSLVALIFTAINSGIIFFQVINHFIPDALANYSDSVSQEMLRFAIASLVFAAPVFYWMQVLVSKGLAKKELSLTAGIRRWLTYFIIFIASVVILVWLIMTMTSFLNGELTLKAALKTLTIMVLAGSIFGYYFYDVRREQVTAKDHFVQLSLLVSLVLILSAFVSALFIMDKPSVVRDQRQDQQTLNELSMIDSGLNQYYTLNQKLPQSLNELTATNGVYLRSEDLLNDAGEAYSYQVTSDRAYQLCATFRLATDRDNKFSYPEPKWDHPADYHCFDLMIAKSELPATPEIVK
jgi:hypothetical protein